MFRFVMLAIGAFMIHAGFQINPHMSDAHAIAFIALCFCGSAYLIVAILTPAIRIFRA